MQIFITVKVVFNMLYDVCYVEKCGGFNKMADEEACCGLLAALTAIYIYLSVIYYFFVYVFEYILYSAALIMAAWILYNFSKACVRCYKRELPGASEIKPTGTQPAYKQYFFRQVYFDLRDITKENYATNTESIKHFFNLIKANLYDGDKTKLIVTWPIGLSLLIAILLAIVFGGGAYILVTLLHISVALLSFLGIIIGSILLIGIENLNMARNRIFFACPNCYEKYLLPTYICDKCGVKHTKLVPGQYGLLKRECECGNNLETLFFNGKNKLEKICPICSNHLNRETGTAINVHYPIIGGQSSGKSSFLVASMIVLNEMSEKEIIDLSFPEDSDENQFKAFESDFKNGIAMVKTVAVDKPRAFLFEIDKKVNKKPPYLIYMYDAAGEIFENLDSLRLHKYYSYVSGIVFLIDPFSIRAVKRQYEAELSDHSKYIKPSKEKLQDIYARMIINMDEHKESRKIFSNGKYKMPIAVVITKSDVFDLDSTILNFDSDDMHCEQSQTDDNIASNQIRSWLYNHGEGNFVRGVESTFTHVRYFSCSALGRMPNETSSEEFIPRNVGEILKWLFSFRNIIT